MKSFAAFLAIGVIFSCGAARAAVCLDTNQIQNTNSPDGKVLILTMKDGKTWRTTLQPACPDIRTEGFQWNTRGGQVCENDQIIRAFRTGQMCRIGQLVQNPPAKVN